MVLFHLQSNWVHFPISAFYFPSFFSCGTIWASDHNRFNVSIINWMFQNDNWIVRPLRSSYASLFPPSSSDYFSTKWRKKNRADWRLAIKNLISIEMRFTNMIWFGFHIQSNPNVWPKHIEAHTVWHKFSCMAIGCMTCENALYLPY